MVFDLIEELPDLDMEPKPESLCWTNTYKDQDTRTLRVGGRDKVWDLPFVKSLMYSDTVFIAMGRGFKAPSAPCARD